MLYKLSKKKKNYNIFNKGKNTFKYSIISYKSKYSLLVKNVLKFLVDLFFKCKFLFKA